MNKKLITLAVAGTLAAPMLAIAEDSPHSFSSNVSLASEYIYRGIEQTNGKPAIQGGFDYAHSSGFYAGVWASNISWLSDGNATVSAPVEIDVYGGYKGSFTDDLGFDVGVLTYNYPGTGLATGAGDPDTTEVYGALSYKWLTAKYSVTTGSLFGWTKGGLGVDKTSGSSYFELNAAFDLGDGWDISGHVGRQSVKGFGDASYSDYKLGVTKDVGFGSVGLAFTDTNAKTTTYTNLLGRDLGKSRTVLTFSKSF